MSFTIGLLAIVTLGIVIGAALYSRRLLHKRRMQGDLESTLAADKPDHIDELPSQN